MHSKIEEETVASMSMFWHFHSNKEIHVDVALLLMGLLENKILQLEGLVGHHVIPVLVSNVAFEVAIHVFMERNVLWRKKITFGF